MRRNPESPAPRLSQRIVREINRRRNLLQRRRLSPIAQRRRNRKPRNQIVRLQKSQRQPKLRRQLIPRRIARGQKNLLHGRNRKRSPRNLQRIRQRPNRRPNRVVRRRKSRLLQRTRRLPPSRLRLQRSPRRLQRSPRRRRRKRSESKKKRSRRACNVLGELSKHPEFSQGAFSTAGDEYGTSAAEAGFILAVLAARLEEAAEKVVESARNVPQALKRGRIFNDLTARVNSRPSLFVEILSFSATSGSRALPGLHTASKAADMSVRSTRAKTLQRDWKSRPSKGACQSGRAYCRVWLDESELELPLML